MENAQCTQCTDSNDQQKINNLFSILTEAITTTINASMIPKVAQTPQEKQDEKVEQTAEKTPPKTPLVGTEPLGPFLESLGTSGQNEKMDEPEDLENLTEQEPNVMKENRTFPKRVRQRDKYEVVFFVKYFKTSRPDADTIQNYFGKYGKVVKIDLPENRNFAFVYMEKLHTKVLVRRTRTTISQIISEMKPGEEFYITVASLRRNHRLWRYPYNSHKRGQRTQWTQRAQWAQRTQRTQWARPYERQKLYRDSY